MITQDDAYKIACETWRFQVNSYWTRNSYFAVFETASVAGVWKLTNGHGVTAVAFSLLCAMLTWVWGDNNRRTHEYVRFWWEEIIRLEKPPAKPKNGRRADPAAITMASRIDEWREEYRKRPRESGLSYSRLIQRVPWLSEWVGDTLSCSMPGT